MAYPWPTTASLDTKEFAREVRLAGLAAAVPVDPGSLARALVFMVVPKGAAPATAVDPPKQ